MQRRFSPRDQPLDIAALLARAAQHLAAGDALSAQRTARTAEQLMTLNARLQRGGQASAARLTDLERALDTRQRELDARHVALNQREFDIACEMQRLEELKESLEALYTEMYKKQPD